MQKKSKIQSKKRKNKAKAAVFFDKLTVAFAFLNKGLKMTVLFGSAFLQNLHISVNSVTVQRIP